MIEVNNLTKFYGDHKAVDNISFSVKDGTVCGFCGPNGAGKSTTMNIMTGCLSATSGTVTIGGYDIFEHPMEAKKLIGYLPEQPPLYLEETPREYLRFIAEAKKVPRERLADEVERVMKETQISDVADRLIKICPKDISSVSGSPRRFWAVRRSSSWMSPPWGSTRSRWWRSAT